MTPNIRSRPLYPRAYTVTDGIIEIRVGGDSALDALLWYSMPTPDEAGRFTYDPAIDTATFLDMVAVPRRRSQNADSRIAEGRARCETCVLCAPIVGDTGYGSCRRHVRLDSVCGEFTPEYISDEVPFA